ncbi:ferredoxin [Mycobacterium arosiense]|uniref:Ferredoxin n=1 Tax=Mycobacterium arosiense ATCC BAA-1401 = DSM 45069 TaxID=1265311 RepID=A0A1W9ZHL2_MYCAI|nr:ferredoxin [Mycobacterium arosiense]ORA15497.1 ferredoxin [Mycobacterium arosiense ATCC BAA-1401 = DSM 45069]
MVLNSSVREDNRLDEMPMAPIVCRNCAAQVLVRKSSWNQTSVQWNAEATARCAERADAERVSAHADRGVFLACAALNESITAAVRRGDLPLVDEIASTPTL